MEQELLTLKDIALRLNLPESTLRKYRDAFPHFIPVVGSGRDRLYRPEATQVFQAIRRYRSGELLSWEDTGKHLAERFTAEGAELDSEAAPEEPPQPTPGEIAVTEIRAELVKLRSASDQQGFMLNTIGGEVVKISSAVKTLQDNLKDIGVMRRTILSQHNDFRTLEKQKKDELFNMLDRLTQVQSTVSYLQKLMERRDATAPMPPRPAPTAPPVIPAASAASAAPAEQKPGASIDDLRRLADIIKERNDEVARLKTANMKLLTEVESLKNRMLELAPAPPQHAPEEEIPEPAIHPPDRFLSGKFVFKGRKK